MQQLKFNNVKSNNDLQKKKSQIMDELLTKEEIKKIKDKLDVSINEFDAYLGYFLSYYEDACDCKNCINIEKCPKEIKGMTLNLVRRDDGSIEREYSLCSKREIQRKMNNNYLIRDFNEDLLEIDLDNVENKKGRFKYEKRIMELDMDYAQEGMFVYGPSASGKSYPLIALCNEFVKNDKKCAFIDVKTFIDSLKATFDFKKEQYGVLMDIVKKADVLVLDNLGEEKQSEWVRDDVISSIIDYRNRNNSLTFITSCFSLEELEKMYNVSKSNSEAGKMKASKFIEKIKAACPNVIKIEAK